MKEKFEVNFLQEAFDFLNSIDEKARNKILSNIEKAKVRNDNSIFKKLNSDVWEFRALVKGIQYRMFAFWDKEDSRFTVVVITHGIIKKTQKTPKREIEKTLKIRRNYFDAKRKKE